MQRFKQFLTEGGGRIFGIDPFGNRSRAEVEKFAADMGYQVVNGPKHIKIINPATGQLVASLSHGANRNEFAERYALKHIGHDLQQSGSKVRPNMDSKQISSLIRRSGKPPGSFPMASIGAAGIAGAGAMVGSALTQGAQAASNAMGGLLTMPPARTRMEREKDLQSDVGLGFDLGADNELVASPEGFRAVASRQKEGKGFKTAFPTEAGTEEDSKEREEIASDYLNANSQYNAYNSNWMTDMYLANTLRPSTGKGRMQAEKMSNSDIGLAFDLSPEGELTGSPEGFKAVSKRHQENRSYPTTSPEITTDQYRNYLMDQLKSLFDPETYKGSK